MARRPGHARVQVEEELRERALEQGRVRRERLVVLEELAQPEVLVARIPRRTLPAVILAHPRADPLHAQQHGHEPHAALGGRRVEVDDIARAVAGEERGVALGRGRRLRGEAVGLGLGAQRGVVGLEAAAPVLQAEARGAEPPGAARAAPAAG